MASDPAGRKRNIYYLIGGIGVAIALAIGIDLYLGAYFLTPIALIVSLIAFVAAYLVYPRRRRREPRDERPP